MARFRSTYGRRSRRSSSGSGKKLQAAQRRARNASAKVRSMKQQQQYAIIGAVALGGFMFFKKK